MLGLYVSSYIEQQHPRCRDNCSLSAHVDCLFVGGNQIPAHGAPGHFRAHMLRFNSIESEAPSWVLRAFPLAAKENGTPSTVLERNSLRNSFPYLHFRLTNYFLCGWGIQASFRMNYLKDSINGLVPPLACNSLLLVPPLKLTFFLTCSHLHF